MNPHTPVPNDTNFPLVNALDYLEPNGALAAVNLKELPLPCWLAIGNNKYQINESNKHAFTLGVLFATAPEWAEARLQLASN